MGMYRVTVECICAEAGLASAADIEQARPICRARLDWREAPDPSVYVIRAYKPV